MLARHWMMSLFVGLQLIPRTSWGQDSPSEDGWLTWSAPPECPKAEHIEAQLERWLGTDYDPARFEVTTSASVTWRGDEWTVKVRLRREDDESTRSVAVGSCTEAADFVALSVALLVNPEFSPAEADEPAEQPSDTPREGEAPENPMEIPEPPSNSSPKSAPEPEPESNERRFPLVALGAGAGLRTGVFPVAAPLAFARIGLRPDGWRMHLGAASVPHLEYTPAAAQNAAVFRSLVAHGEVCRVWTSGSVSVGPCVGLEGGALTAEEKGGDPTTLFWSSVQVLGEAEMAWSWGGVFLEVGAQVPFTRPEFVLEGGTVVHRSEAGFDGKLGFSVFL